MSRHLLQVMRSQDASVCSSINLHWDGVGIIDLDCSDDTLSLTANNIHCVLRCNGIEDYCNWFRVLIAVSTIICLLRRFSAGKCPGLCNLGFAQSR